jgi:hypothetical protein
LDVVVVLLGVLLVRLLDHAIAAAENTAIQGAPLDVVFVSTSDEPSSHASTRSLPTFERPFLHFVYAACDAAVRMSRLILLFAFVLFAWSTIWSQLLGGIHVQGAPRSVSRLITVAAWLFEVLAALRLLQFTLLMFRRSTWTR